MLATPPKTVRGRAYQPNQRDLEPKEEKRAFEREHEPVNRTSYAIFCPLIKLRTVSLGCAPTPSQYFMRSESNLISAGFLSGSYVPTASRTRPSRARVLSM